MKTSRITHVVLYAKNFYRHTGNVVKDMQRFMELDGHKWHTIDTPEKVAKVMKHDYLEWANSIEDEHDRNYVLNEADEQVSWAEGPEAIIWHMLISYSGSKIPMIGSQIGYPKYDKYHLPQFCLKERLFVKTMSFDEMDKKAKEFLDTTQEDRMDDYMNRLLDSYNFELAFDLFKKIGDTTIKSYHDLEDEIWNEYTKFMENNLQSDGSIKFNFYHFYTPHFHITFNTINHRVDICVEAIFHKHSVSFIDDTKTKSIKDCLKQLFFELNSDESTIDINESCKIAKEINEELPGELYDCATDFDATYKCHKEMLNTILEHDLKEKDTTECFIKNNGCTWQTGGHIYEIKYDSNTNHYTLTIYLEAIYNCSIMDSELLTRNLFIDAEKM